MARATFINAILSGKLDGAVYARNKGGAYVRAWVKPTNPKTLAQSTVRSSFTDASKTFGTFTRGEKNQWNYYATSYFKPKRKKAGVIYSGFNAFTSLYNGQLQSNNNLRTVELYADNDLVTATYAGIYVSTDIPTNGYTGQPVNDVGASVPLNLEAFELGEDGSFLATISQGNTNDGAPLTFDNIGEGRQVGFLFFGNVPNSNTPSENNCIGYTGVPTITAGWTVETTSFQFFSDTDSAFVAKRKNFYKAGQSCIVSAYAVSNYGEMAYLGNVGVNVVANVNAPV